MKPMNSIFLALLFVLVSCAKQEPGKPDEKLAEVLKPVQGKYSPDRRIGVFNLTATWIGEKVIAKGEVDNPAAKEEALRVLRSASGKEVLDSITVLPDPRFGTRQFGIVTVSVGNMRGKPGQSEELVTQVLMGMVVKLLKKQGGWYYVQSHDKYLGWIEDDALVIGDEKAVNDWIAAPKVIATDYFGVIREEPVVTSQPVSDVVAGVLLGKRGQKGSWVSVGLPDGRQGYIERSVVQEYSAWKKSRRLTAENVEKIAKMFVGVPYLWGGTSTKGFDCSGYTKIVYRMNGFELNRDANQQALMGDEAMAGKDFEGLKKGDLLFFGRKATEEKPERIWHVGIYLGNKEFIHCAGRVRVNSFDPTAPHYDPDRLNTFVRARRVIGGAQVPEVG